MNRRLPVLYRIARWIVRAGLGFYFVRIERFHRERVPPAGPVLFTANHPNSLTDSFVIGTSIPRKVNFVATVRLFQFRPLRWLLTRWGVIPINRVKDDPHAMRTVAGTFEACYRVLERGEAIGIFPEGLTQDDLQLKALKTGAARMALELEHRHGGRLGLQIVPVGLTFSEKERYRSYALVSFGEPLRAADLLPAYSENRHAAIQALTDEIARRIKALILHLPHLERARIVEAVKRLYLDRLWAGNSVIHEPITPFAGEVLLTQAITRAVENAFERHPERAANFVHKLNQYERLLKQLHLSDETLAYFGNRQKLAIRSLACALMAVLGAPVALYGWLHRLLPATLLECAVKRASKTPADKTHISTATIIGGIILFTFFYLVYTRIFHQFFGWRATLWYAFSLPPASLAAYYYTRELRRFSAAFRATMVLLRAPSAARSLLARRAELISLIEAERSELAAGGRPEFVPAQNPITQLIGPTGGKRL